jgi:hypothetical protein
MRRCPVLAILTTFKVVPVAARLAPCLKPARYAAEGGYCADFMRRCPVLAILTTLKVVPVAARPAPCLKPARYAAEVPVIGVLLNSHR